MAKLTSAKRKRLASSEFAGPGRSYPVNDKSHARNALARASEEYAKGNLTASEHERIVAKAHAKLKGKK